MLGTNLSNILKKKGIKMKKKIFALVLVLAMALSLAACGGNNAPAPAAPGGTTPGGTTPGGTTPGGTAPGGTPAAPVEITVAFQAMPNGLCPVTEDVFQCVSPTMLVYDHLVELDGNWAMQPGVATSWKQVDPLNWQFEIDLSHKFHNGAQLTMEDVVFSLERLKGIPKSAHVAGRMAKVSYEGTTLNIELTAPNNAAIPQILWFSIIVNKAYIEANGDDAVFNNIVGTGPYVLTEFTPGASIRVEKWEDYPFEKPQITAYNFIAIPENTNRYIAVESGQIDYAGLVTAFEIDLAKRDGRFNIIEELSARTCTFFFNVERAPFSDPNVRLAFAHAFDRESFCDLAGGRHPLESSVFGGFDLYYVSEYLPEFNIDKARALFEAAGINPTNRLAVDLIHFFPDPGIEVFQSTLRGLGVDLNASLTEFAVYLSRESNGDHDMCFAGLSNRGGTPLVDLERYDSTFIGSRNNSRYVNPVMDELIGKIRATMDRNELVQLGKTINDLAAQENVFIPGYLQGNYSVMDSRLGGITIRGDMVQIFRNAVFAG